MKLQSISLYMLLLLGNCFASSAKDYAVEWKSKNIILSGKDYTLQAVFYSGTEDLASGIVVQPKPVQSEDYPIYFNGVAFEFSLETVHGPFIVNRGWLHLVLSSVVFLVVPIPEDFNWNNDYDFNAYIERFAPSHSSLR